MATEKEEVKEDIDPKEEETEEEVESEEGVDDEEKETPEKPSKPKKTEESEEESEESEEDEEEESEEDENPEDDGLKDIPGETNRERALRAQVTKLRGKLREERKEELFSKEKKETDDTKVEEDPEYEKILSKYDPKELKSMEEIFKALSGKLGFVKKGEVQSQSYKQVADNLLDDFLDDHPEYKPENDPDNVLWESFKTELSYYKKPKNPREYKKLFNRVHKEVYGVKSKKDLNKVRAKEKKIKVASHSSSSPQGAKAQKTQKIKLDPSYKEHLKGFTEEEKDELFEE